MTETERKRWRRAGALSAPDERERDGQLIAVVGVCRSKSRVLGAAMAGEGRESRVLVAAMEGADMAGRTWQGRRKPIGWSPEKGAAVKGLAGATEDGRRRGAHGVAGQ
ncbi:hypothetical protein ABZP36_013843 [Zizania latifolia]